MSRLPKDAGDPDGERARSIVIDQVRGLGPMLATAPALAPRRVIVIDAIDELEGGAPNALLISRLLLTEVSNACRLMIKLLMHQWRWSQSINGLIVGRGYASCVASHVDQSWC